ncbi:MAG: helix-hairpin-helix domain-containing protein [Arcanobacterium sp.]|nr:helix-hairpin-helix domain-containing protein [Arcanobacterium sp.]
MPQLDTAQQQRLAMPLRRFAAQRSAHEFARVALSAGLGADIAALTDTGSGPQIALAQTARTANPAQKQSVESQRSVKPVRSAESVEPVRSVKSAEPVRSVKPVGRARSGFAQRPVPAARAADESAAERRGAAGSNSAGSCAVGSGGAEYYAAGPGGMDKHIAAGNATVARSRWALSAAGIRAVCILLGLLLGLAGAAVAFGKQRVVPIAGAQLEGVEAQLEGAKNVGNSPASIPANTPSGGSAAEIVVYVSGAVKNPGVVKLPAPARLVDAVQAAGGFAQNAQPAAINLAALAHDGQHIHVLKNGESAQQLPADLVGSSAGGGTSGDANGKDSGARNSLQSTGSEATSARVNINLASARELESLPGIGPVMAERIVKWRTQHGSFHSVHDLLNITGLGQKLLAKIEPLVTVS